MIKVKRFIKGNKLVVKIRELEVGILFGKTYWKPETVSYRQTGGWSFHFLNFIIMKPKYLKPCCY